MKQVAAARKIGEGVALDEIALLLVDQGGKRQQIERRVSEKAKIFVWLASLFRTGAITVASTSRAVSDLSSLGFRSARRSRSTSASRIVAASPM